MDGWMCVCAGRLDGWLDGASELELELGMPDVCAGTLWMTKPFPAVILRMIHLSLPLFQLLPLFPLHPCASETQDAIAETTLLRAVERGHHRTARRIQTHIREIYLYTYIYTYKHTYLLT